MRARISPLSRRVLSRLFTAEAQEIDLWLRDDLRIARLTVFYAATGEAVLCSPHVLASYEVLGLHPEKVWPAIQARRKALGPLCDAPPKKPAHSIKLWFEKTNSARAVNSRAHETLLRDNTISVPMAAPSIAALYRNSDATSSANTRAYTLGELKQIVYYSGAEHAVRALTFSALEARGPWPKEDGPATSLVSVSVTGMMIDGNCCRRTVYYRIQRALGLGYWRHMRRANSWTDCPKCGEKRRMGKCAKCGYQGQVKDEDGKYTGEFTRSNVYEFDVQKFVAAPRCKEIRHPDWRTYAEYKAAAKRGEHPNLAEMPSRNPAQPVLQSNPPAPAAPLPKQPAAEHEHRSTERAPQPQPKMTKRECAKFVANMAELMRGCEGSVQTRDGSQIWVTPTSHPELYRPKMNWREALAMVCASWKRTEESAMEALKFWGYQLRE